MGGVERRDIMITNHPPALLGPKQRVKICFVVGFSTAHFSACHQTTQNQHLVSTTYSTQHPSRLFSLQCTPGGRAVRGTRRKRTVFCRIISPFLRSASSVQYQGMGSSKQSCLLTQKGEVIQRTRRRIQRMIDCRHVGRVRRTAKKKRQQRDHLTPSFNSSSFSMCSHRSSGKCILPQAYTPSLPLSHLFVQLRPSWSSSSPLLHIHCFISAVVIIVHGSSSGPNSSQAVASLLVCCVFIGGRQSAETWNSRLKAFSETAALRENKLFSPTSVIHHDETEKSPPLTCNQLSTISLIPPNSSCRVGLRELAAAC